MTTASEKTTLEKNENLQTQDKYTVITFAPVQGFIEKSRKLRDLYGASQILSYLSYCLVKEVEKVYSDHQLQVISPAGTDLIQGMPNRILVLGDINHDRAFNLFRETLYEAWSKIVKACKDWVEQEIKSYVDEEARHEYSWEKYDWNMSWKRWQMHAWEIFVGQGATIADAMKDLETRKLRRAWAVPNWNGESSSLSGHDAIAHPHMDREITHESKHNSHDLTAEIKAFYKALAQKLDPHGKENDRAYINENERLSIPELIKRLVTYEDVRNQIDYYKVILKEDSKSFELESFTKLLRKDEEKQETYWTGWFMGDGDRIGNYLKNLSNSDQVREFSSCLRSWGRSFREDFGLGRVVYAGGDDFLGVIYGTEDKPQRDKQEVIDWLCGLRSEWERLRNNMREKGLRVNDGEEPDVSLSVGFVWAGHSVPQRDVLQHCREAEKLAKSLGRDRVTIRVMFNNGQYVQWTTPWGCLEWLKHYKDREGGTNWSHVYSDLAMLKARHAIPPESAKNQDSAIALALLDLYFSQNGMDGNSRKSEVLSKNPLNITGGSTDRNLIQWIENMINVGWQLCSNT